MSDMTIGDLVSEEELDRLRLRARERGETFETYLRDVLRREAGPSEPERLTRQKEALNRLAKIRARSKPMSEAEAERFFDELREERDARLNPMIATAE